MSIDETPPIYATYMDHNYTVLACHSICQINPGCKWFALSISKSCSVAESDRGRAPKQGAWAVPRDCLPVSLPNYQLTLLVIFL
jgi:hypothetical protein